MSRIGKRVLSIPAGVNVNVENGVVTVKGPKGELTLDLVKNIEVKVDETLTNTAHLFHLTIHKQLLLHLKRSF